MINWAQPAQPAAAEPPQGEESKAEAPATETEQHTTNTEKPEGNNADLGIEFSISEAPEQPSDDLSAQLEKMFGVNTLDELSKQISELKAAGSKEGYVKPEHEWQKRILAMKDQADLIPFLEAQSYNPDTVDERSVLMRAIRNEHKGLSPELQRFMYEETYGLKEIHDDMDEAERSAAQRHNNLVRVKKAQVLNDYSENMEALKARFAKEDPIAAEAKLREARDRYTKAIAKGFMDEENKFSKMAFVAGEKDGKPINGSVDFAKLVDSPDDIDMEMSKAGIAMMSNPIEWIQKELYSDGVPDYSAIKRMMLFAKYGDQIMGKMFGIGSQDAVRGRWNQITKPEKAEQKTDSNGIGWKM